MPPIRARVLDTWDTVRSSYWFIPSLMAVAAAALALGLTRADGLVGAGWVEAVSFLQDGTRPEGARAFLSTVAGSMIGVAGVTFSITIASVVYATGQYGPRLLTNFMDDRGNQVTLGTFIATFLYCLLVLRTVRSADEAGGVGEFVPHLAILGALALTLASIGVFIFFIHHVPESIHVSNLVAGVGRDLLDRTESLFPERIGEAGTTREAGRDPTAQTSMPDGFFDEARRVAADGAGYVRGVDAEALLDLATAHDLVVRVRHRPGDFVAAGDALVLAWPPDRVTDEVAADVRASFAWGSQRTARQDTRFLVDELVEIAARALSPGVNDPFTAVSCLDWLSAALKSLAARDFPEPTRHDEGGALRVVAQPTTFGEFVEDVYSQLRPYVVADRNATLHALTTIGEVAGRVADRSQREALREQADALLQGATDSLTIDADRRDVRERHRDVSRLLAGHVGFEALAAQTDVVGGTA
ncbi:DUF2254 domain-containing protein [Rubrivirga sp. S365]|uniref:DUF2254 domain-containing protein n=1 Tax=Rubrivirga litoralis TaxID=3075598 RepID=A0ABU3BRE3_9BACT|nr:MULTISPECIES: DUF2254 domain-containing protein [unclassified Rubrivirga]MDT0631862.1 DUF2254 domain-containing protein [Rubrivirga sp. F394]MDT7857915.1 DUF2254 domain-containing protein [Rubrivirga sp. S365]